MSRDVCYVRNLRKLNDGALDSCRDHTGNQEPPVDPDRGFSMKMPFLVGG